MPVRFAVLFSAVVAAVFVGCDGGQTRFRGDATLRAPLSETAWIDAALADLFGAPDEPQLPDVVDFLDRDALKQAAGPVISHTPGVTQGLYRRHCARCHGVSGDGRGPAAYDQHPSPRDFRLGVFKWKRTYRDARPTADDLLAVIEHGVPGTSMPSFSLLADDERDSLWQYVVYLSLRGQLERELVWFADNELGDGEIPEQEAANAVALELLAPLAASWTAAGNAIVEAPSAPTETASIELGRTLYHSERAGCAKCHGKDGAGRGVAESDYDDWTRQRIVTNPSPDVARLIAHDLPLRPATNSGLVGRRPRGGAGRDDLFRRLHQGVAGTPMPAVGPRRPGERSALSDREIAALVDYVRSLMDVSPDGQPTRIAGRQG